MMSDFISKYTQNEAIQLKSQFFEQKGVSVYLKPEYLNHRTISGNKWWKLKYNLEEALKQKAKTLLTFGGAYSNHIRATAAAAKEAGLASIGIIRGEEVRPLNDVLTFAKACGMDLHYVSREDYRGKTEVDFIDRLQHQFGDFYLIPEGGTNQLAVKGCEEWGKQLLVSHDFDFLCLPVGTGGTMAGLVCGLAGEKKIVGISVLKGGGFLAHEVEKLIESQTEKTYTNWSVNADYHFGGYAKTTSELIELMTSFEEMFQIPLDHVYTGKLIFGVMNLIRSDYFKAGSTILILHTGGILSGDIC